MPRSPPSAALQPTDSLLASRQLVGRLLWLGAAFAIGSALFLAVLLSNLAQQPMDSGELQLRGLAIRLWAGSLAVAVALGLYFYRVQGRLDQAQLESKVMAQEALSASEERIRLLVENIQEVFWLSDAATNSVIYVSPSYQTIWGRSCESLYADGADWFKSIHAEDRDRVLKAARGLRQADGKFVEEYRIVRPDGAIRWVRARASPVLDEQGKVIRMTGVAEDITERKTAQSERTQTLERISDAVVALDLDWRYSYVNERAGELFGRDAQSLLGKHIWTEFPDGVGQKFHLAYEKAMAEQKTVFLEEYYPPFKRWFSNSIYPAPDGLTIYFRDVTKRKQAEQVLTRSEQRLRDIIDGMGANMFVTMLSTDGLILEVNKPALQVWGLTREDVLQRPLVEMPLFSYSEKIRKNIDAAIRRAATGESSRSDLRVQVGPGKFMVLDLSLEPMRDEMGRVVNLVASGNEITERRKSERALKESERRFRQMAETVREAFWLFDVESQRTLYISPAFEQIWGRSVAGQLADSSTWLETIHPQDRERAMQAYKARDRSGAYNQEYRIVRSDGSVRWVHDRASPIRNAEGRIVRFSGVAEDITERKLVDEALRESRERFTVLADFSMLGIRLIEGESITYVNQAHGEITGLSTEETLGLSANQLIDMVHPEERAATRDRQEKVRRGEYLDEANELRIRHRGGEWRWVISATRSLHIRGRAARLVMLMDITERKLAEEALRNSEERYRVLVEWSPDAIVVHAQGKIVYANSSAVNLLGAKTSNEVVGHSLLERTHPDSHSMVEGRLKEFVVKGLPAPIDEIKVLTLDGSAVEVEIQSVPIIYNGMEARHTVVRDIRARKRAQEALLESRRQLQVLSGRVLEAQETERRRVAHELHDELGQSLTAIKINLQAGSRLASSSKVDINNENIRIVEAALAHVRQLALALRPSMLDDLGLEPALHWLSEQTAKRTGMAIQLQSPDDLQRLAPDIETACFRIVQEALTNIMRHAQAKRVDIKFQRSDDELLLTVQDDGVGFGPLAMRQRAKEGTSMGMLGMQERATLIGGTLVIDSNPGQGSRLTLRCPWRIREEQS